MKASNPSLRPLRSFEVSASIIADSLYLVRGNDAFELGAVESFIWSHCDGKSTMQQIAEKAITEFEAPAEEVRKDALEFMDQLAAEGLVELS